MFLTPILWCLCSSRYLSGCMPYTNRWHSIGRGDNDETSIYLQSPSFMHAQTSARKRKQFASVFSTNKQVARKKYDSILCSRSCASPVSLLECTTNRTIPDNQSYDPMCSSVKPIVRYYLLHLHNQRRNQEAAPEKKYVEGTLVCTHLFSHHFPLIWATTFLQYI